MKKERLFIAFLGTALVLTVGQWDWAGPAFLLIMGIFVAFFVGNPFAKKTSVSAKYLLQASIILMGFKYDFSAVMSIGSQSVWVSLVTILLILGVGSLCSRWLKIPYESGTLISCGTCICGGSAIAAVGGVIKADHKAMAVSLGVIFLLNAVALLIFPPLGRLLGLNMVEFGYWSGIAIQDTSSVVGAAQSYGQEALALAIPVKLSRALWIIPLSLFVGWRYRKHCHQTGVEGGGRFSFPWFILFFLIASLLKTFLPVGEVVYGGLSFVGELSIVFTLYLIGLGMSKKAIVEVGWKALVLGIVLWAVLGLTSLAWIYFCVKV